MMQRIKTIEEMKFQMRKKLEQGTKDRQNRR